MTRSNLRFVGLVGLVLMLVSACEQTPVTYVGEFAVGGYTFPIAIRTVNGIGVRYVVGLVSVTTNPDVKIEQLQDLLKKFDGEILRLWEVPELKELDVMMRMLFWKDPFEVATELGRSALVKYAEPVYVSTPGKP